MIPDPVKDAVLSVSVVVPTRNRPSNALGCVTSVLANRGLHELVVVDQSDDSGTEEALATIADARLRCVRSALRGATNGRNLGIDVTRGDIVAFIDDDCRARQDWIANLHEIFAHDPEAAVVCGQVRVPDEISARGFAASFDPQVREWRGRLSPLSHDWGLTANMSIRRAVIRDVGAFDPFLGVGAPLHSGEEPDFLFRVLKAGFKVVNAREVQVDHFGVRPHGEEATDLLKDYALGTAAAFLKYVRLGDVDGIALYLQHIAGFGKGIVTNLRHLHRPIGIGYALAFFTGSLASLKYRVDRERRVYAGTRG
jgi:glycosyltransferase involved in cell wall biosynthesis